LTTFPINFITSGLFLLSSAYSFSVYPKLKTSTIYHRVLLFGLISALIITSFVSIYSLLSFMNPGEGFAAIGTAIGIFSSLYIGALIILILTPILLISTSLGILVKKLF